MRVLMFNEFSNFLIDFAICLLDEWFVGSFFLIFVSLVKVVEIYLKTVWDCSGFSFLCKKMPSVLHQRSTHSSLANSYPLSPRSSSSSERSFSIFSPINLLALLSLIVILGVFLPWMNIQESIFSSSKVSNSKWREYSLAEAASFVAKNGTVIVCAVSQPYLPFLNNWLISLTRQKHHEKVLVIAEDYATLYKVNERWPGHAVLVPPAPDAQTAHKFGSQVCF